jgi:ABC-type glycerol-3-phosphate transport system permease component
MTGAADTPAAFGAGDIAAVPKPLPRARKRGARLAIELPLLGFLIVFVAPIAWMVVLAFQPDRIIIDPSTWNLEFTTRNIAAILAPDEPFATQMLNSVLIVIGSVALSTAIATLAAYGLAKLSIPALIGWPVAAVCTVLPLVPPMVLVPGFYITLAQLHLLSSIGGLILVNTVLNLPFATVVMRLAFMDIPTSLREAAIIDGAGESRVLMQIMLPLAAPGLATTALFTAIMTWNEFLMALTMTSGGTTSPVSVGIAAMVQPYDMHWGQMGAAGTLAVVPIILLTIVANKRIVAGLTRGAVKG